MKRLLILTSDYPPNIGGIAVDTMRLFRLLKKKYSVDLYAFGIRGENRDDSYFLKTSKILFPIHLRKIISRDRYDAILVRTVLPLGWMLNFMKIQSKKIYFAYGQELLHDINSKPLFRPEVKSILGGADTIVVNSDFTNSLIEKRGRVYYPLIDDVGSSIKKESSKFKIIMVGRFVPHKNFISVIRMIREINESVSKITGRSVELEVIGEGIMKSEYEDYISRTKLSEIVKIRGKMNVESMNEIYSSADVIVMPSVKTNENVEGFGMVAQEAGLCGAVCAGYDSGGISESIEDRELLAEENDEKGLMDIIVKLLANKEFCEEKRLFSMNRAKKYISSAKRLEEFETILDV
ncbi:MAG: glycosyltransferase family 4 protein [bacterium]